MNQYKFLLKRLPFTLCLVLALTLLPVTARAEEDFSPDYTWYEGGTEESYTITTARQLLALANLVNGTDEQTKTDFAGKTIKLGADLDLSVYGSAWNGGKGWIPIGIKWASGDTGQVFKGTFNGQYHTITGLYINDSTTSDNTGLFGVIADGGTVKNLGLTGVNITGYWYVGGVVGEQLLQGTVEACYATGKVESYSSVGGLVGAVSSSGAVRNCAVLNLAQAGKTSVVQWGAPQAHWRETWPLTECPS